MHRRHYLALVATVVGAGCSSDTADEPSPPATDAPTPTPDPEPAYLDVTNIDINEPVPHDEDVTLEILLTNRGDEAASQRLIAYVDGEEITTETVSVDGGEQTTVFVGLPPLELLSGEYPLTIETEDARHVGSIHISHPNPYDSRELTVALTEEIDVGSDIHEIIRDALAYWEEYAETYAGYDISYDYIPNVSDPDIEIHVVGEIVTCGIHTGEIMGCAPLVTDDAPKTVEIRIVAGYRPEWMRTTLKHELGHTLGLDHDDEPAEIMSDDPGDRIPNYLDRVVALNAYAAGVDVFNSGTTAWNEAIDALEREDDAEGESWAHEAATSYATAEHDFKNVVAIARKLDEDEAAETIEPMVERSELMTAAAVELRSAARAFQRNSPRTGNQHIENAIEYLDATQEIEFVESRTVRDLFGFPVREEERHEARHLATSIAE